ncbi:MAG TPA: hypothetical protein VFA65_13165 [Bryobacteraceae bacterium]|nr:hypothetical protein [Bryobacteraceae bacterium]
MRTFLRVTAAICALTHFSAAATSTTWEISGFSDFLKGRLKGLSLTADGLLKPGPSFKWNAGLDQPALWSLAAAPDGTIYAATGNQGKVFHVTTDGKVSTMWSAEQSQVFALCTTPQGMLYAGSSPNGGLYLLQNGKAELVWKSPAKYIWAIQAAPDGALYVATGEVGRIYRVVPNGKADVYYETGQANVTALALGPNHHLYAGTDPNGIIYDISAANTGTVLYDSTLPEIRAIAVDSIGTVYAAAMGGAVSTRPATALPTAAGSSGTVVATTPTVITVTEQAGMKVTPETGKTSTSTSSTTSSATSNTAVVEVSGVEKSAIYRIAPNHAIETLRSSKEDNVFDLIVENGAVLFSTDDRGRIYRLTGVGMHKTTLIAEPGDGETTRLLETKLGMYAALSNPARVVLLGPEGSEPASYESQVHDSTSVARWGHLQWHGTGSGLVFRTRTGNAARPDSTWSPWSAPISEPDKALIQSPPARFIQWRAEWPAGNQSEINTVSVPYLSQNSPPAIHSITVTSISGTNAAKTAATSSTSTAAYSVTVTDTGEPPATSTSTTNTQTVSKLQTSQTQISWQADDPDGDKLVYTVYFRAEDEQEWQLIRSHMFENTLLLDPDVFADGRYFFKVLASDAPSNSFEYTLETEMVSTPVLIDNTPPLVTLGNPSRNGMLVELDVDAADKTSPLRLCEYSLDAGLWQPVESVDGVTDSPHERFHLKLDNVRPGEHLLVVRVYDSANNAGLARVVLR